MRGRQKTKYIGPVVQELQWSWEVGGALQRKSHLCISFLGIGGLSLNVHIHVSVSDLYITSVGFLSGIFSPDRDDF
jgi:hypothetical protein